MNKITIFNDKVKADLGDMFGIFFEDLNHAADGGLYGEMIQNRSFEFDPVDNGKYTHMTAWEKVERQGKAQDYILDKGAFCETNPHYLCLNILEEGNAVGIRNTGFEPGIFVEEGKKYIFTIYAKRDDNIDKSIKVSLVSKENDKSVVVYCEKIFNITKEWHKYEFELTSNTTDYEARLELTAEGKGKVYFDFVSLFPKDTFKGRKNGLRKDLGEYLENLHPKFMRFPGGCLVHDGSLNPNDRNSQYRWKNTIGEIEKRPARRNNWGYNQTLGLGYFEYFQFCEDINTKPLPVLPGGCDPHHRRYADFNELQPFIDDALDLIEFANGDKNTKWGKIRCELGHEAPFKLEYIGIGNEEVSEPFFKRYPLFVKAIKEKYPDIKVIGTSGPFAAGGEYERGWEASKATATDYVDEHYYMSPEWFLANYHRYDDFKADEPKVFLGEYASWGNTWYNALVEGAYMTGLQNNAHAVGLACYAPLFCNVNYRNWQPDMIWFDNHRSYVTPNYYVQKMFMDYQGNELLETICEFDSENEQPDLYPHTIPGDITVSAKDVDVEYTCIKITDIDTGNVVTHDDVLIEKGQKDVVIGNVQYTNYIVEMKAREINGTKGFFMEFGRIDDKNSNTWEIGGWQNLDTAVCRNTAGRNACLSQYEFSVEKDRVYELKLQVNGRHIMTYIDGVKIHDIEDKQTVIEPLYLTASKKENKVIVKLVNVSKKSKKTEIILNSCKEGKAKAVVAYMTGYSRNDINDFDNPEKVIMKKDNILLDIPAFEVEIPGESIYVYELEL